MDAILGIFFIFLILGGFGWLLKLIGSGTSAAINTAKGRGTFKENLEVQYKGMGPLEMRVEDNVAGDNDLPIWTVKLRGLFQIGEAKNIRVVTSLLDITDDQPKPILSAFDDFQEPDTPAFQWTQELGICEPGQGFMHWASSGLVPKDLLKYPLSGTRKILIVARVVDANYPPNINHGFAAKHPGIIQELQETKMVSVEQGFLERSAEALGSAAATIRLGLATAFSDKSFDPLEGKIIKQWSSKFIDEIPDGQGRENARSYINDAIRFGVKDAGANSLSISAQVEALNKLAGIAEKYAAVELCMDVMAADGTADPQEIKMLNRLCESLNLDPERFSNLKDRRLLTVESQAVDGANIWEVLSIDESLDDATKLKKLKQLYIKWNGAAETLGEGHERDKAHERLELIAEAHKLLNA